VGPSVFFHLDTVGVDPIPSLLTLHGERTLAARRTPVPGRILREVDWVIGSSAMVLELARRKVPEMSDRSSVIYNGVERPRIAPEPLPIRAPRLLCLGRLSPEKGFDLALTVFSALVRRYQGIRLIIAGDGPARAELEQQARTLHIDTSVDFLGWVAPEAVPSLLNSVTLVLMPSRTESLPLAALEAGLMARPVVAARVGGLPEVVVDGETGLLVERDDIRALTEAVSFLLDNADTAARMGLNARKRAQDVFGWRQHVDAYVALYRRLGDSRGILE
jgi:glycogen(starch) synthase